MPFVLALVVVRELQISSFEHPLPFCLSLAIQNSTSSFLANFRAPGPKVLKHKIPSAQNKHASSILSHAATPSPGTDMQTRKSKRSREGEGARNTIQVASRKRLHSRGVAEADTLMANAISKAKILRLKKRSCSSATDRTHGANRQAVTTARALEKVLSVGNLLDIEDALATFLSRPLASELRRLPSSGAAVSGKTADGRVEGK